MDKNGPETRLNQTQKKIEMIIIAYMKWSSMVEACIEKNDQSYM